MRKITAILSAAVIILTFSCAGLESAGDAGLPPEGAPESGELSAGDETSESGLEPGTVPEIEDESLQAEAEEDDFTGYPPAPPLARGELLSLVKEMLPWNMVQVHDDGVPYIVIHDLDKNGYEDALVLAVEGDSQTDASAQNLSESSRLFQAEKEYFDYFLLIFYQYSDDLILRYTVPVSRQLVFDGMSPFEIRKDSDFPYALLMSFRTRAGIEKELVILSGFGITSMTLRENLSEFSHIEDIDGDGYVDIIIHEQGFEEGTGFETFLTWYKWNSREYSEFSNTNIVRNLREFFTHSSDLLKDGSFEAFFDFALDSEALRELKKQELTDTEIFMRVFRPADDSPGWAEFCDRDNFTAVVFPEIMETPFSYDSRNEFRHTVSVRFSIPGGDSRICRAELRMKQNPFQEKQFCFCPGLE